MKPRTLQEALIHVGIVICLSALIIFSFFYIILPIITRQHDAVTVPDLRKMGLQTAIQTLESRDLRYEISEDSSYNGKLPPHSVLDQYPMPLSKVKIDRRVRLTLNAKVPPTVNYPDLSGTTLNFAQRIFHTVGLKTGNITYRPDMAKNAILESYIKGQTIHAGQAIPKGSTIDLVVGSDEIMPDHD